MKLHVINRELCVGNIQIHGVASSSLFIIGDANSIRLDSIFDTPPESLIIGPLTEENKIT